MYVLKSNTSEKVLPILRKEVELGCCLCIKSLPQLGSLATNVKRHVLLFVLVVDGGVFAFVADDVVDAVVTV